MSRGIKYVREGYAEGGRIPVYGREGDIAYYIDAPPATSQSQPIASFASPVTQGTLTMPGPGPGVYAGHYVPGRTDRTFSPFGFADYTRGSQTNPFAQLVGLRSPEFIPIQSTLGRGYESIYGANLPEGRFDVSADPGVSVTPLTTEEKVNYLKDILQPVVTPAPVTPPPAPAPVTPVPVTPAPVTPAPVTPAPVTPVPVTPSPVTPAPVTPTPITPVPVTPAPVTPAPVTPPPAPVAPSTITTSLPAPAYEYNGRIYSSYADLRKAIDDDVAARRAQRAATLSDLVRESESDYGGELRDTDLPGDVRSDLPPDREAQTEGTARSTDPGDATGLGAGRGSVTSEELTPDEATLRRDEQIRREQGLSLKDDEALRNLQDVLETIPAAQLPGDDILAGSSGNESLTETSTQALSPADRIAQDVMSGIAGKDPSVAANMGVRGTYDPMAPNASALQGLAAAIGAAAPFAGIGGGIPVVGGALGLVGSGIMDQLGLNLPGSSVLSAARNPVGTAASALLGEEGRRAVDAQFTRETAEMARSYADQVLSGNMSPSMAAAAASQDLGTVGRIGAVLDAIDRAAEVAGVGTQGYSTSPMFGGPGQDIHSTDPGTLGGGEGGGGDYGGGAQAEGPNVESPGAEGGFMAKGGHINMSHLVDHIKRQVRKDLARGGYVPGHSGGMDDDVPAVIDGRRPARLSSGEFVFDAATVAALGDGNNAAGAKKLNQLRHAIRQKAYGHRRQPPKNYSLGDLVGMA